jgi:hypothetical protein
VHGDEEEAPQHVEPVAADKAGAAVAEEPAAAPSK